MNKISIISACRNESAHIRSFLDSLLSQDMADMQWEAVVADGMSTDDTRAILESYSRKHSNLRFIDNPGRIVSTGLNEAIRASTGEIILRMDAHTRYATDYCLRCVETLEQTGADNVGGPARTSAQGVLPQAIAAAYHSPFSTGGAKFHDPSYEGPVDTVTYGCWRRTTLERIGGFDETLVRNQDDELNLRLLRSGGSIWQNPRIMSWYSPRATLSGLFHQYFQYGFWKVAVIKKHGKPGSWRHLVPAGFALANGLLLASIAIAAMFSASKLLLPASILWLVMISLYASANLVASFAVGYQSGWKLLPYLPFVFLAYHLSYGSGFLAGMFRFRSSSAGSFTNESVFARITR